MRDIIHYEFKQIYDNKSIILYINHNIQLSNFKQVINYDIKQHYNLESDEYDIIDGNAPINNQYNEIEHNLPINLNNDSLITNIYNNNNIFYIKPKNMDQLVICNICNYFCNLQNYTILSCCSQSICNTCINNIQICPYCRFNL